jgi:hypothetical protein
MPPASVWPEIEGGGLIVIVSEADFLGSATEVAVTVAVIFAPEVGAVYVTGLPVVALNVPPPLTVQLTPLPSESCATAAAMLSVCPWSIVCAAPGDNVTEGELEPHPYINAEAKTETSRTRFISVSFSRYLSNKLNFPS